MILHLPLPKKQIGKQKLKIYKVHMISLCDLYTEGPLLGTGILLRALLFLRVHRYNDPFSCFCCLVLPTAKVAPFLGFLHV